VAVVLVSGGMDSCVAALEARAAGYDPAFLHGQYGQRTEARELACFHAIADRLGVPRARRFVADMRYLGAIGGSSLTDRRIPVEPSPLVGADGRIVESAPIAARAPRTARDGTASSSPERHAARGATDLGAGRDSIPTSYVPFRNAHFLSIAVSWAETIRAEAVFLGALEEDSSGYPDCREAFFRAFEEAADLGTRPETRIRIVTPLIHLDKAAIVRRGIELGAPLELTWSCYEESELACGVCDSCALRLRGFALAGASDPIPYRGGRR
jgi:7-cyano-7-deazaguanine synthase